MVPSMVVLDLDLGCVVIRHELNWHHTSSAKTNSLGTLRVATAHDRAAALLALARNENGSSTAYILETYNFYNRSVIPKRKKNSDQRWGSNHAPKVRPPPSGTCLAGAGVSAGAGGGRRAAAGRQAGRWPAAAAAAIGRSLAARREQVEEVTRTDEPKLPSGGGFA